MSTDMTESLAEMYVVEVGPGHIRAYRDPNHPEVVEAMKAADDAERPELRRLADLYGVDPSDHELDQVGRACRQVGCGYESAFQLLDAFGKTARYPRGEESS